MKPFTAAVSGAFGGLAAGFVAQSGVTAAGKLGFGWAALQGPHGPPFFPTALFLGIFYGAIAAAISRNWQAAAIGLGGPLLGMSVPLAILERIAVWNWGGELADRRWMIATVGVYAVSVWGTIGALGWRLGGRWTGLAAAVGASLVAFAALSGLQALVPALTQGPWQPTGVLPQASVLLDGLLTGSLLGLSIALARRHDEKARNA